MLQTTTAFLETLKKNGWKYKDLQELENGGAAYSSYTGTYGGSGCLTGNFCLDTLLCNLCCNPCFSPCC